MGLHLTNAQMADKNVPTILKCSIASPLAEASYVDRDLSIEVASALFDDSGLADALERIPVLFARQVDNDLRRPHDALRPFVKLSFEMSGRQIGSLIETPEWKDIIQSARIILATIEHLT